MTSIPVSLCKGCMSHVFVPVTCDCRLHVPNMNDVMQTSATTNPEPYCAELYNARELPYGFFSFDLPQLFGQGFPVFFDINLSADDVQSFYEYVQEGLYYDSNTRYSFELSY